ncbi:MAG TPA: response regulator transcription factor [Saprospiraceae bacterium]|nr:response regulator transcription factor [Saprospiraceae bacterium]
MNCILIDNSDESLKKLTKMVDSVRFLTLEGVFSQSIDAINYVQEKKVDLIFLEIDLPDIQGWDLLKAIPNHPLVIVITAKADYAVQAFEQHVVDFLLKPVQLPRFLDAVNFAKRIYESRQVQNHLKEVIFVKTNGKWVKLEIDKIKYIQAMGDYVRIFTDTKSWVVNKTMKSILEGLPAPLFARVHRSYIVNVSRIENIEENSIVIDKDIIPISEHYKADFLKKLNVI